MKTTKPILALAALMWCSITLVNAQSQPPRGFKDSLKKEFDKHEHCFHKDHFEDYYQAELRNFQHMEYLKLYPSKKYDPSAKKTNTPCGNGTFAGGIDVTEWTGVHGTLIYNSQGLFVQNSLTNGIFSGVINDANAHQTVVNSGTDPNVGISLLPPTGTTQAVRLGNQMNGRGFELLEKTFTVTQNLTQIRFWYATVMQSPNHFNLVNPNFTVEVIDNSTGIAHQNACDLGNGSNSIIGDINDPFLQNSGSLAYRDWSCAVINLAPFVGRSVTIRFINRDCSQGAHYGYSYISDICGSCAGSPMGSVELGKTSDCGPGRICVRLTVPTNGHQSGAANAQLLIYQNGTLVQTLWSQSYLSNTNYCFNIDAALLGTLDVSAGGFDFVVQGNFYLSGFTLPQQVIGGAPDGQMAGQNNDYLITCDTGCCPGTNYLPPNIFEDPNVNFGSDYTFNPVHSVSSVLPGQYTIGNSSQALSIAPTWNVNCPSYQNHLLVNGLTGLSGEAVIFEYMVNVDPGTYRFCMAAKNLPQCAFDVMPIIDVLFEGITGYDLNNLSINTGSGPCVWDEIAHTIEVPNGVSSITIKIQLDQSGQGDGNDLALDKIQLIKIEQVSAADVLASINVSDVDDDGSFNVLANPVTGAWASPGCSYSWSVMELDANYQTVPGTMVENPLSWQTLPNPLAFNGYVGTDVVSGSDPGVFYLDNRYRFVFSVECDCKTKNQSSWIYDPMRSRNSSTKEPVFFQEFEQPETQKSQENSSQSPYWHSDNLLNQNDEMKVFPSPTRDQVFVKMNEPLKSGEFVLSDMQGRIIERKTIQETDMVEFSTRGLSAGTYVIRAFNGLFSEQKFFVKE